MPGDTLPTLPPFDIYGVGAGTPMAELLTHPEVEAVASGAQISVEPASLRLILQSGGTVPESPVQLYIHAPVPSTFTFECSVHLSSLPSNFSATAKSHVFVGVFAAGGPVIGLFVSKIGLAYSGSCHVDASGDLVIDGPFQPLVEPEVPFQELDSVTFRLAVDAQTGVAYIYATKSTDVASLGHKLRHMMPVLSASQMAVVPPTETMISVRGTNALPVSVGLEVLGLGHGLIIANLPPHADAGSDQAIRTCNVAQLDGTRSFDPEGAPLLYMWRLVDGPFGSQHEFQGSDGLTFPLATPTGFTDHLHSASLGALHARDPLAAGDVVLVRGAAHDLLGTGSDANGFFARIGGLELPDALGGPTPFKVLRQRGVTGRSTPKPTFYPDVPGFYKFDLRVSDGDLTSETAVTVLNVTESPIARGNVPDLRFLWDALSDFWALVEDTDRVETYWSGLAQVAASELLHLWEVDYSKSLRDIQRTAQRRWLHYDLGMHEAFPELTSFRAVWSGLESLELVGSGVAGVAGTHLDLLFGENPSPLVIAIQGSGATSPSAVADELRAALARVDTRLQVRVIERRAATTVRIRIDAPYGLSVAPSSTAPLFAPGARNRMPLGTGASTNPRSYRVDRSLKDLGLSEGDFLLLGDTAYRIARVVDDPSDPWPYQRVTLLDPIPVPAPAAWSLPGQIASSSLDFWRGLVTLGDTASVEVVAGDQSTRNVELSALGACAQAPDRLAVDLTPIATYLAQAPAFGVFLRSVSRRTFLPRHPLVVDVPLLQERVIPGTDAEVLRRNLDFFLETYRGDPCIRFVTGEEADVWQKGPPPLRLWAETTYVDNRPTVEGNFGIPADFSLDDLSRLPHNVDYLSAVRGLWYAYFNGPTLFNLRVGVQILLGLPFAEEPGTITEIRSDFSSTQGRILVRDLSSTEIVRSYSFPQTLPVATNPGTQRPYAVGDVVRQFAPLVEGVEVLDYLKDPLWFRGYLQQGAMLEVEKFFRFLVRVDASAFNLAALLFVQSFILRVKPTYTLPIFVVLRSIGETEIYVNDVVSARARVFLDAGVCELTAWGATMFDQARPAGGGWKSDYDQRPLALGPPSPYPLASEPITWGFDKAGTLCPDYDVLGTARVEFTAATGPSFDSIFGFDSPVLTGTGQQVRWSFDVALAPGTYWVHRSM